MEMKLAEQNTTGCVFDMKLELKLGDVHVYSLLKDHMG
jgi:hypothetical protein